MLILAFLIHEQDLSLDGKVRVSLAALDPADFFHGLWFPAWLLRFNWVLDSFLINIAKRVHQFCFTNAKLTVQRIGLFDEFSQFFYFPIEHL